mgnify:CR=1 FL=1
MSSEIFIERAKNTHGDKYDYSLVDYKNNYTKIKIYCKEHGIFEQLPKNHLNGSGCFRCNGTKKSDTNEFIANSNIVHKNKYDYSKTIYLGANVDVEILCPIHGLFKQRASRHLIGSICPKCNHTQSSNSQRDSKEQFIEKAKKVHGVQFDYSNVVYINNKTKIEIICKKHGSWWQTPINHIKNKQKCPFCNESKGEKIIKTFLETNNVYFERQKMFENCKDIRKLPFDFYLPEYNTCIEFNGIHHYKPVEYFGGIKTTKSQQKRDVIKNNFCLENNISLLVIKYTDNIENVLKNFLFL